MMLKSVVCTGLLIAISLKAPAQKMCLFVYPTTAIAGDISVGAEHYFIGRFSHELSFNIKVLPNSWYRYDEGYRVNYQVKYEFLSHWAFRFSGGISFDHWNIWFDDKVLEHHNMDELSTSQEIYGITRESWRFTTYGVGLVFSPVFFIGKKITLGADLIGAYGRGFSTRTLHEVLYYDPNLEQPESVSKSSSYNTFIPFIRAKIGCFLN